jgi:CHRD domain/Bacterial Ig domain
MSIVLRVRQALPAAPLCGITALAALAACGGGGMEMAPSSMSTGVMGSGSMNMSCSGMDMGMSCPAPTIVIVVPAGTVSRTVTLRAQVTSMPGDAMTRVDFMIDGTRVGTTNGKAFGVSWDSTTVNDGAHTLSATVSDSLDQTASASPVTIEVDNHPVFTVALSSAQIIPAPASAGSGTAHLSVDLGTGAVSGTLTLSGVTATAVTLNEAFAGSSGPGLLSLSPGAGGNAWQVPAGALLTAEQVTALLQGALYLMASTAANPGGELRGQITPANVMVNFSVMSGTQEVPAVAINAAGVVATTVDTVANMLTVHVHATGVDDASAAAIDQGAAGVSGPQLAALTKDDIDPGHWSTQLSAVSAADIAAFKVSDWYVNVVTPADPQGAIRGQIELTGH